MTQHPLVNLLFTQVGDILQDRRNPAPQRLPKRSYPILDRDEFPIQVGLVHAFQGTND